MLHYTTYGGTYLSAQPEKDNDGFTPVANRNGTANAADGGNSLTGSFDGLNETIDVRPTKGESISIVHPQFQEPNGDELNTGFDERGISPISGNGVFKPQDTDTKGSVIWGDNHFKTDRVGDSITGEVNELKGARTLSWRDIRDHNHSKLAVEPDIWTTGGASTFEGRPIWTIGGTASLEGRSFAGSTLNANDAFVFETGLSIEGLHDSVHCIVGGTMCSVAQEGTELQKVDLRSENRFVLERFDALPEMNSFGESLNPALEVGSTAGPGGTSFMKGSFGFIIDNIGGSDGQGGDDI